MTPQDAMRHALEWIEAQPEPRMIGAAKIIEALRSALATTAEYVPCYSKSILEMEQQPELSTASKSEQLLASQDHALRAEFQRMKAALAQQGEQQPDGLPLVISGAIFDFAGYLTTRPKVIEVGSAANASPMVELIKEWADLRGLSLDDAAVQSWQEWLPTGAAPAAQPTCKQDLQVETEQERYVRMCPDIECGRKKRCTRMVGVSCMSRADIAPAAQPLSIEEVEQINAQWNYEIHGDRTRYIARMVERSHGIGVQK